jgi:hypothetical protein
VFYERYSPHHPSCHDLRSEQVEVEDMDMPEVEGMGMVEEQDHPMNRRLGEEGMNMVGSNMVKVDVMDMVEEHFHPVNNRSEMEGIDMMLSVEEWIRVKKRVKMWWKGGEMNSNHGGYL